VNTSAATSRRPLRIGIQLPEVERVVRWPEYLAMAHAAEDVGFDSIWLGDHLLYRGDGRPERGPWEVFTSLAALAAVTERVQLGPLVACTAFHPPGLIAKMAATVDEVSAGRMVLGLGAGWNRAEFDAFGLAYDRRVERFGEAYAIIEQLLSGHRVSLEGRHWSADDAVLLPPSARPSGRVPIMVGSNGERVLRMTLPTADVWNTWFTDFGNVAERFSDLTARVTELALEAGRDPATVARSACVLVALESHSDERPLEPEAPPIEGTGDQIAERLRDIAEAGADEIIIVASPIDERSVRRLGEVIAQLRG
jgi:probable F420-dependent oxidoreductase